MSLVPSTRKTGQDNFVVHCSILDIEREATKSTSFMCCSYISPPLRMRCLCLSYSRCSIRLIRSCIGAEINTASSYNFGIMSPKSPVTAERQKNDVSLCQRVLSSNSLHTSVLLCMEFLIFQSYNPLCPYV